MNGTKCKTCNNILKSCIDCKDKIDNKNCDICYGVCTTQFYLECCKIPIICIDCIDNLETPMCPFCRTPITSLLNNEKYRLSKSCPTTNIIDNLSQDTIQRINMEDDVYNYRVFNNTRRFKHDNRDYNRNTRVGSYDPNYRISIRRNIHHQMNEDLQYYKDIRHNNISYNSLDELPNDEIEQDQIIHEMLNQFNILSQDNIKLNEFNDNIFDFEPDS